MDIGASNWNEADAANSTASPDGAPEGMAPSGVNDTIRAIMGASKRLFAWLSNKLTAGTSTAYSISYAVAPGGPWDGVTHLVEFHTANGAAATLDINALGAKPLHYYSAGAWRTLPPNLFDANEVFRVAYHAGTGAYRMLHFRNGTGETREFAGSTAPKGSLLCNGAAVSRTIYAGLFAAIGTSHGVGDGNTTFNVPNHTGRFVRGGTPGAAGGASTHLHTTSGSVSGTAFINLNTGAPFGAPTGFTLGSTIIPGDGHQHPVNGTAPVTGTSSGSTNSANHLPPFISENKIIRI